MGFTKHKTIGFMLMMVLALVAVSSLANALDGSMADASDSIASSKSRLLDCFLEEQKAEAQGADITGLLDTLNQAASYVRSAELAYMNNDSFAAIGFAVECQNKLANFDSEVVAAKEAADNEARIVSAVLFFSVSGAVVVLVAGIVTYSELNRKVKRLQVHAVELDKV